MCLLTVSVKRAQEDVMLKQYSSLDLFFKLEKTREFALNSKHIHSNAVKVGPLRSSVEKEAWIMILAEIVL